MLSSVVARDSARNARTRSLTSGGNYALYRNRFLWRFARMRLRRLCFEIFAFRLFLREPIYEFTSCGLDPTMEHV